MQQEFYFSGTQKPPKPERSFHWRHIEGSAPLQRMLRLLCDGLMHSTRDIDRTAEICAVSTAASELNHNGIVVECEQVVAGETVNGLELPPAFYYHVPAAHIEAARERLAQAEKILKGKSV